MRKPTLLLMLSAAMLALGTIRTEACTNVIVTKGASTDGSQMVSYAADSHWLYGELYCRKAAKWKKGSLLWKGLLFNGSVLMLYTLLLLVLGLPALTREFQGMGRILLAVLLIVGNVTFFLLDRVLERPFFRKLGRYGR